MVSANPDRRPVSGSSSKLLLSADLSLSDDSSLSDVAALDDGEFVSSKYHTGFLFVFLNGGECLTSKCHRWGVVRPAPSARTGNLFLGPSSAVGLASLISAVAGAARCRVRAFPGAELAVERVQSG